MNDLCCIVLMTLNPKTIECKSSLSSLVYKSRNGFHPRVSKVDRPIVDGDLNSTVWIILINLVKFALGLTRAT